MLLYNDVEKHEKIYLDVATDDSDEVSATKTIGRPSNASKEVSPFRYTKELNDVFLLWCGIDLKSMVQFNSSQYTSW